MFRNKHQFYSKKNQFESVFFFYYKLDLSCDLVRNNVSKIILQSALRMVYNFANSDHFNYNLTMDMEWLDSVRCDPGQLYNY